MTTLVVGVAGKIASGKSDFIRGLSERLDAATCGFGDHVRAEAQARGLDPTSRETLQALGEELKDQLGDRGFVRRVLSGSPENRNLVVDGIRHVEVADIISSVVDPREFFLIFLDTPDEVRRERAAARGLDDAGRLSQLAGHSTEQQVHDGSLRARADVLLDATVEVPVLVDHAVAALADAQRRG